MLYILYTLKRLWRAAPDTIAHASADANEPEGPQRDGCQRKVPENIISLGFRA